MGHRDHHDWHNVAGATSTPEGRHRARLIAKEAEADDDADDEPVEFEPAPELVALMRRHRAG